MKRLAVVGVVLAMAGLTAAASADPSPDNTVSFTCSTAPPDSQVLPSCAWYPEAVRVTWSWTNEGGELNTDGCDTRTETADSPPGGVSVTCTVTYPDGTASATAVLGVDTTPPEDHAGLSRQPDSNGWYNSPVALDMSGSSDASSGVDFNTCSPATYSQPDSETATLTGNCKDIAGNPGPDDATPPFKYDATPPTIASAGLDRPPDSNGWYNHTVGLALTANDNLSGPAGCTTPTYSGPDGAGAQLAGTCSDVAGNTVTGGTTFGYDSTAPGVRVAADRSPDHNGWYNHPVSFAVSGADAVSGVAACNGNTTYSGPESGAAVVGGECRDNAGNVGFGGTVFKYDASRPSPADVQVTPGNRRVDVSWTVPSDATSVTLVRALQGSSAAPKVVYAGTHNSFVDTHLQNGAKYSYTVADIDQAGNSTTKTVRAIPTASSLRPFVGSVVGAPPLLTWKKVKRARYYNVQLYLGRTKVMSKWPHTASLQIPPTWHYRGKTYTLTPGHYRWYVWPGFGSVSAHRYGDRIGRSSFRVTG